MAVQSSNFFTLAGFLELLVVKPKTRNRKHRYWFMFDESKCELRYFEKHTDDLHNPVGTIPMSDVRLSLSVPDREKGAQTVVVTGGSSEYHLIAPSVKAAQNWYCRIQEKTEAYRKLAKQPTRNVQVGPQSHFSMVLPTSPASHSPGRTRRSFVEVTDFGGGECSSPDKPGEHQSISRSMSADDMVRPKAEDSSTPPPVPPMTPVVVSSIHTPTPTAVIHPQTIAQVPTDDPSSSEPPPLPPKSSFWKSAATPPLPSPDRSIKQPQDTKQAVPVGPKVYYNIVPEHLKKMEHLQHQLDEEKAKTKELRDILDRITKSDPTANSTRWQNTLHELQEVTKKNSELSSVITTLNEQQSRSQESQRQFESRLEEERGRYNLLQLELNHWKARYTQMVGYQMEIPTASLGFGPTVATLSREDQMQRKVLESMLRDDCLEKEVNTLFSNPGTLCDFEDECGDMYFAENDGLAYRHLTRRLYLRYTEDLVEEMCTRWKEFCDKQTGRYLDLSSDKKREEVRQLLWKGLPMADKCRGSRVKLWESCIHRLVGDKQRYLDDQQNSKTYYQNLLEAAESNESPHSKQIYLDLPRTLPYNVHFKPNMDAVNKMSNILHAFCHHIPQIGYTQGMNLLVAISLFYLDEESAFWCLVAIVEKVLPSDYYTHGLLSSQADQAVLQNLVEKEMPQLSKHMAKHGIDVSLVTINWFLTIFADALPTEAVVRVWDLFLLDGRIALFCLTLALLRLNESKLLRIHDPVNLLQYLKNMSRHSFDVEPILQEVQQMYPTTRMASFIEKRFHEHYKKLKGEFTKREKERRLVEDLAREQDEKLQRMIQEEEGDRRREGTEAQREEELLGQPSPGIPLTTVRQRVFTVGGYLGQETSPAENQKWLASCACENNEVWLVFQYPSGDISTVSVCVGPSIRMTPVKAKLPKKPMSMHYHSPSGLVLVGTLDFQLLAFSHQSQCEVWSCIMKDSVLDITSLGNSVFLAIADGTIAKLSNVSESPPQLAPELLTLSSDTRNSSVQSIVALEEGNTIWCAAGNAIIIVNTEEMQRVESLDTNMPQRNPVNHLFLSQFGVWATYRSSTVVSLYDINDHSRLFHMDYKTAVYRKEVPDTSESTGLDLRITGFLVNGKYVWIGTGGGSVILFTVSTPTRSRMRQVQRKPLPYPAGVPMHRKRLRSTLPGLLMQTRGDTEAVNPLVATVEVDRQTSAFSLSGFPHVVPRKSSTPPPTAHNGMVPGEYREEEDANMYTLEFVLSCSVAKSTDHVRKLLAFDSEKAHRVMTCVRASNDETSPIQIWNCDQDDPQKWSPRTLDC